MATKEQLDFVLNYINRGFREPAAAYMEAYPKCKSLQAAHVSASRLLKKDDIKALIKESIESVLSEKKISLEHTLFNYYLIRATYDPTEIIDLNGNLVMTESELRRRGLHVVFDNINKKINNQGMAYMEYKLADRDKAADMLTKYIQMIKPLPTVNMNFERGDPEHMTPEDEKFYQEQMAALKGKKST